MGQIDYAKLAKQHGGVASGPAPVDYAALAAEVTAEAETPKRGLLSPSTLDDFPVVNMAKGVWDAVKAIPGAAYQAVTDPIGTIQGIGQAQGQLGVDAADAYQRGDYLTAATKGAKYLLPVVGPMMDAGGETMAREGIARGIGKLGAETLMTVAPFAPKGAKVKPPIVAGPTNPAEAAANAFARERGIPLDLGTASGRQLIKNTQKRVGNTIAGEGPALEMQAAQTQALQRVGGELADQAGPKPTNPVAAGESVRAAIDTRIQSLDETAGKAYGRLEQFEKGAPDEVVPTKAQPVATDPKALDRSFILRWLADDLTELPYQSSGRMRGVQASDTMAEATSQEAGRRAVYTPRVAGSQVQDTLNLAGISGTKAELAERITRQLRTGKIDPKLAKIADAYAEAWDGQQFDFDLVNDQTMANAGIRRRSMKSPQTMPDVTEPGASRFFADQALPEVPKPIESQTQKLAVDLRNIKQGPLKGIREELQAQNKSVPFADGTGKARALRALDKLFDGPDFQPLSVTDKVLSELKAMARGADMPELRTQGQGIAAQAVKELDAAVRARALKAGPDVLKALEDGRAATKQKWAVADVRDLLSGEPGQVFRQLTQGKDVGLNRLREVAKVAPEELPNVARAFLEDMMNTATQEGGFGHADRLWADWQKLGPETKKQLFPKPGQIKALDDFFLLAKKIKENPNPSGTAQVLGSPRLNFAEILAYIPAKATAKMLYSPKAIRYLTTARRASQSPSRASQALAVSQLTKAAQSAGISLDALPAFAGEPAQQTREQKPR